MAKRFPQLLRFLSTQQQPSLQQKKPFLTVRRGIYLFGGIGLTVAGYYEYENIKEIDEKINQELEPEERLIRNWGVIFYFISLIFKEKAYNCLFLGNIL